ncbi:hypothetical protein EDD18DRAFT_1359167 [Armillaria luteobubalina]|uniref:Uncharacterized protein n=1 Tax=Armillaria luteobubalina TaxID=153913 RepID=A0AA39PSP8_9AGAR|nr:hypothetical protein EDD18DRAFT_1359167 [Armillaria luteobubalina]
MDSYIILDSSDFIMDFTFTVNGVDAPTSEQGQHFVAKLVKDRLYASNNVYNFLHAHHDTIDPSYTPQEIPGLVVMALQTWSIWIEGQNGGPVLTAALPLKNGDNNANEEVHAIQVPFFCKGCKGTSHPTTQCPLKVQLEDILKKPQEEGP